jgi:hypothetical protein
MLPSLYHLHTEQSDKENKQHGGRNMAMGGQLHATDDLHLRENNDAQEKRQDQDGRHDEQGSLVSTENGTPTIQSASRFFTGLLVNCASIMAVKHKTVINIIA